MGTIEDILAAIPSEQSIKEIIVDGEPIGFYVDRQDLTKEQRDAQLPYSIAVRAQKMRNAVQRHCDKLIDEAGLAAGPKGLDVLAARATKEAEIAPEKAQALADVTTWEAAAPITVSVRDYVP